MGFDSGAKGNRTPDLFIANETLYQLSYSPVPLTAARQPQRTGLWYACLLLAHQLVRLVLYAGWYGPGRSRCAHHAVMPTRGL